MFSLVVEKTSSETFCFNFGETSGTFLVEALCAVDTKVGDRALESNHRQEMGG